MITSITITVLCKSTYFLVGNWRFAATGTLLSRYVEAVLPTPANERRDLLGEVLSAVLAPAQFLEMLCLCHLHRGKHGKFTSRPVSVASRLCVASGVCRRA